VIENVEILNAEIQGEALGKAKSPAHREIGLVDRKTPEIIAPKVSLITGWRCRERCGVQAPDSW
jgi:hypothetical protein